MKKLIEYYEFPGGVIIKRVDSDRVYRYDETAKTWNEDYSLTAEFAWDRPYGEPSENLRQKIDLSAELPPFPDEKEFFAGNTVVFGAYPQKTIYDFSPVEWIVLENDGENAVCISKQGLIVSGYCNPHAPGKPEWFWWEHSIARDVCNHHFFETAFSDAEKARIVPKTVSDAVYGKVCTDAVFLLSEKEVLRYFPEEHQRKAKPTNCAIQKGAGIFKAQDEKEYAGWWLLPDENSYGVKGDVYPKAVTPTGEINFHGRNIYHTDYTIRPCVVIKYKNI